MPPPRKVIIKPLVTQLTGTERIGLEKLDNPYQYELTPQTLDQTAGIAEERAARIAADQALLAQIINETVARIAGDAAQAAALDDAIAAEARTRAAADMTEQMARMVADAALVPRAELCSLWSQCDLRFLPTSDPGFGKPWLSNGHVVVGPVTPALPSPDYDIGMENGTDQWSTEDSGPGVGVWVWG